MVGVWWVYGVVMTAELTHLKDELNQKDDTEDGRAYINTHRLERD